MVIAERGLGGGFQAEGDGRRDAPAVAMNEVAARHMGVVRHHVQAHGHVVADDAVDIGRGAAVLGAAQADGGTDEIFRLRRLADQVDAAAGRRASAIGRVRALDDFDLLQRKDLARLRARIADAVDIGVGLGVVATDKQVVADRVAAFAGADGNARHGAQRVRQRDGARLRNDFGRNYGHRFRRIEQRRGQLVRGRFDRRLDQALGRPHHFNFLQLLRCVHRLRVRGKRQGQRGKGGQGRAMQARRRCRLVLAAAENGTGLAGACCVFQGHRFSFSMSDE